MTTTEWLTYRDAVARATMYGMSHEAADVGITNATNDRVIESRMEVHDLPIPDTPDIQRSTVWYVSSADLDEWVKKIKGTARKTKGADLPSLTGKILTVR